MKHVIASVLLVVVSAQAGAFWGWNDTGNYGYGNSYGDGLMDGIGRADAEADFTFDFNFTASMRGEGRGYGNGYGDVQGYGRGHNAHIPYYGAPYGYVPSQPAPPATAR